LYVIINIFVNFAYNIIDINHNILYYNYTKSEILYL